MLHALCALVDLFFYAVMMLTALYAFVLLTNPRDPPYTPGSLDFDAWKARQAQRGERPTRR